MASVGVASVPHIRALTCRQFIHRTGRQDLNWLHIAQRRAGRLPMNIVRRWMHSGSGAAPTEHKSSAVAARVRVRVIFEIRVH